MEKYVPGIRGILARNIKTARGRLGISQEVLAERAELSKPHISDIENGRKWPSADALEQLAEALLLEPFMLLRPPEYSSERDPYSLLTQYDSMVREGIQGVLDTSFQQVLRDQLSSPSQEEAAEDPEPETGRDPQPPGQPNREHPEDETSTDDSE
jgi:transcriptional regulator with XRE-family HTH domain